MHEYIEYAFPNPADGGDTSVNVSLIRVGDVVRAYVEGRPVAVASWADHPEIVAGLETYHSDLDWREDPGGPKRVRGRLKRSISNTK